MEAEWEVAWEVKEAVDHNAFLSCCSKKQGICC
jgi:hypothetical protein